MCAAIEEAGGTVIRFPVIRIVPRRAGEIEDDLGLIVKQSEIALENARKHGEIFMLPIWKRLGWLQKLLFRDHFAKTMTGLAAL